MGSNGFIVEFAIRSWVWIKPMDGWMNGWIDVPYLVWSGLGWAGLVRVLLK